MALPDIYGVGERFISMARKKWWKYRIAYEWNINPEDVAQWDTETIMEALGAIAIKEAARSGGG